MTHPLPTKHPELWTPQELGSKVHGTHSKHLGGRIFIGQENANVLRPNLSNSVSKVQLAKKNEAQYKIKAMRFHSK